MAFKKPDDVTPFLGREVALTPEERAYGMELISGIQAHIQGPLTPATARLLEYEFKFTGELERLFDSLGKDPDAGYVLRELIQDPDRAIPFVMARYVQVVATQIVSDGGGVFTKLIPHAFKYGPDGIEVSVEGVDALRGVVARTAGELRHSVKGLGAHSSLPAHEVRAALPASPELLSLTGVVDSAYEKVRRDELEGLISEYLDELAPFFGVKAYVRVSLTVDQLEYLYGELRNIKQYIEENRGASSDPQVLEMLKDNLRDCLVEMGRLGLYFSEFHGKQADVVVRDIDLRSLDRLIQEREAEVRVAIDAFNRRSHIVRALAPCLNRHPDPDGSERLSFANNRKFVQGVMAYTRGLPIKY